MNNNILHKLFLTLTLVLLTLGASAQVTVSGNVSDESGEPIIGATVMEALTTNGVVTDFDGNFKIQVKNENATLKISYIGMVAQNIRVGNQRNIKVVLKDESQKINEVVVVGYGHQKKESVVGAISQVSSDDLLNTPTANVTQAIAGKIPGVVTTQVSGAPGADDATINIRGRATFAGDGAPLVMVDGVERAFSQVAASDIEMYRKSCAGELTGADALLYPNVDWYDEVLNNWAPSQRYNVSVRGGTKRMRYYVSGEIYNQGSLIKNLSQDAYGNSSSPGYNRYAFRANMDFFLSKDLTFSVNFGTRFENRHGSNTNESSTNYDIFARINHTPGWIFPVSYEVQNGETTKTLYGGTAVYQNNVVAALAKGGYYRGTNTINETNFIADYKMDWLTPGLSARGMVSFDYDSYYKKTFGAAFATYELNDRNNFTSADAYTKYNVDGDLAYSKGSSTTYKLYMEGQINYARKFGKHDVTGMVLYNQNDYRYNSDLAKRYQGLVGRVTYGYDDKYLAEVNVGYNGSENFLKGKRFGFFPAFSLGWRVTQEEFMKPTENWLNNLKIRASYGEVGNDVYTVGGVAQRFLYEEKWNQISNDYYFGNTGKTGIFENQYPNYGVTWERAKKFNVGLEFGLFNGMLTGNFDYFVENRNDILTEYLSRPQWVGVTMAAGNLGKTQNKGYELELHHFNHIGKDFTYNIGATFSHAANKIKNMDEPAYKTAYRKREGHPINQYFGLVCEGFVTQADLDNPNFPVSTYGNVKVGDLKYKDMNNDGFIDDRDETFIGYSDIPENTYALTLGANYKGIGFEVMFQGVDHVSRYYDSDAMFAFQNNGKVKDIHLNRWNPAKSEAENLATAEYPLLHYGSNGDHNQRQNSFFLKNGSFVRLKNIELSYTFPKELIKHIGMSNARFYINANNLFTWDHLDDLVDPESNGSNRYPLLKTVNVGFNVVF